VAWTYRKSISAGPFRINLSRSGIGYSVGGKGFRVGTDSRGRRYTSTSIPGTGLRNVSYQGKSSGAGCAGVLALLAVVIVVCVLFV
jgi:hypothetical protein